MTQTSSAPILPNSESIGFIGLGAMGAPMARRLATLGYSLLVFDLNQSAVQSVVDCGARRADSVSAIASEARLVFTCLPSLEALHQVILGPQGLGEGGAVQAVVDFSTTGSTFACSIADGLRGRGVMLLDAPITGNVTTAGNGSLGIMCSGPKAAYDMAERAMHDLASAIVLYLGEETGKAQRLKLLNNLLSATGMATSCEAFILGVKWGLDPQVMLQVINDGEASSSATRNKFPQAVLPRRFDFGARMAITAKDTSLTVKESEELGVPMWIGQSVRQIWNYAASQGGWNLDGTSLITFLEPWAGVVVKGASSPLEVPVVRPGGEIVPLLVICDVQMLSAVSKRLREQGWNCEVIGEGHAAEDQVSDGPDKNARHCKLVGVPSDSDRKSIMAVVQSSGVSDVTVINLLVMATDASIAMASDCTLLGCRYLDAALTGTAEEVERGERGVLAAGDRQTYENALPVLSALGKRVFYISEKTGAAHMMQIIDGSVSDTLLAATCESYVTGAKAGLAPLTMTKILGVETGRNAASERIIPMQVATRKFNHGKRISHACRELSLLSDEARKLGVTPWILDKARLLYTLAAQLGSPDDDISRVVTHYETWAGAKVQTPTDDRNASA